MVAISRSLRGIRITSLLRRSVTTIRYQKLLLTRRSIIKSIKISFQILSSNSSSQRRLYFSSYQGFVLLQTSQFLINQLILGNMPSQQQFLASIAYIFSLPRQLAVGDQQVSIIIQARRCTLYGIYFLSQYSRNPLLLREYSAREILRFKLGRNFLYPTIITSLAFLYVSSSLAAVF